MRAKGSRRAYLSTVRAGIERNLSDLLIMEDHMDWDIRSYGQLRESSYVNKSAAAAFDFRNNRFLVWALRTYISTDFQRRWQ